MGKRITSYHTGIEGLILQCTTPGCPAIDPGSNEMVPQPNRSRFKCPTCGSGVVVAVEEDDSLSNKNVQYIVVRKEPINLKDLNEKLEKLRGDLGLSRKDLEKIRKVYE